MPSDRTYHQTDDELERARDLSLKRTRPPADVPGYEPQEFLGAGAYGEVWVALDQNTGRQVAIKFYLHRGGLDWTLLSREVEKLVLLSADRYVVQVLGVGWDAEPPHYVMEYVEKGSLDDLLTKHGPLATEEATEMFREVAVGLMHAHGKGVLHCDLKPANILLDQDHKPRLADFGQSRLSHEQTPALGTLFYMAPEQANLEAIPDARWDVYALGALFYCMLTGEPPFRSDRMLTDIDSATDLTERLRKYRRAIQSASRPAAHRAVAGVDRALADIIDRCLAANPEDRYANLQGVLDALDTREEARARRPLVTLGFVGPALLMLVMLLAGYNGYRNSVGSAKHGVAQKAVESNRFAAEFVSQAVAHQLDRYILAARRVSEDRTFQDLLASTVEDENLVPSLEQLRDPTADLDELKPTRQLFVEHEARAPLQDRMEAILHDPEHPRAASWFVNGPRGVQIASAFHKPPRKSPKGKYFGYRTYFTGLAADSTKTEPPPAHVTKTHLSAIFKSTASYTWKVAISTPVMRDGEFLGVLAITADMGSFMEFGGRGMHFSDNRFAVLVDGRPGDSHGAILQHPLYDTILARPQVTQLPERLGEYRVPLNEANDEQKLSLYRDPLADDDEGKAEYDRAWIAARAPVHLMPQGLRERPDPKDTDTGLIVLVEDVYDEAVAPVQQLGPQLVWIGVVALLAVVVVVTLQWYFVVRLLNHRSRAAAKRSAQRSGLTPLYNQTTLTAQHPDETGR
jgi:serine/threonine protein kinase